MLVRKQQVIVFDEALVVLLTEKPFGYGVLCVMAYRMNVERRYINFSKFHLTDLHLRQHFHSLAIHRYLCK